MRSFPKQPVWTLSLMALVAVSLFAAGCGGGGGGGGTGDRTGEDTLPVILGLQTPLGLQGTRGVGSEVSIVYQLRDREFDAADVEVQFGVDRDRDGTIQDSEFRPATQASGGDGRSDLDATPGNGATHTFVWDSLADVTSERFVTQDFVYTQTGRVARDDFGEPIFQNFPGTVVRIRPSAEVGIGAWRYSDPFDLNNNNRPFVSVESVVIPPEGTSDDTVNEQVLVNWTGGDPDEDPLTIAVDWVSVPQGFDVGSQSMEDLEGLPWTPATSGSLGEGTYDLAASPSGIPHVFSWNSVPDAGTVNQWMLLRFRPIDGKLEVGDWFYSSEPFHLDNYTIFTDPDASLPTPLAGARATLLRTDVESVLITGGSATEGGDGTDSASLFYPGRSQTTKGTIAPISGGMTQARVGHTQTRLLDGRVLITGGAGVGGAVAASAEIFDPEDRSFTAIEDMGTARRDHVAVLLNSGDVLVAGGRNESGYLAGAEVYRISSNSFESVSGLLSMGDARSGAQAVKLPDGRVLVTGGVGDAGTLATSEIYDPALSGFGVTDSSSDLSSAREGHSLTAALDGTYAAVAAGGMSSDPTDGIERFDWKKDSFMDAGVTMRDGRAYHVAVLLGDGRILFAGGQTTETGVLTSTADLYDPSSDTLDLPNGDLQTAVRSAGVAILEQGRPVIFGGLVSSAATDAVQIFTPDGGFNQRPVAQIADMLGSVEPWSFGVRVRYRVIDPEGDPARIVCQFKIKAASGDDSNKLDSDFLDVWHSATMRAQTVLGDMSSGLTGLSTREDYVDTVDDPIDAPDVDPGEHLFVWNTQKDIPKGDYSNAFFRIFVYGAEEGTGVEGARFSIAKNAPVIARLEEPLNTWGNLVVPFYLQDADEGELARLEWEYGVDGNGDGKIVEADGESWNTVRRAQVAETVNGTSYSDAGITDVVTGSVDPDPNNDKTVSGIPYGKKHYLVWDTVYDLGAPASSRSDLILRATPYDYPSGSPGDASLGISQEISGFTVEKDPNGLYLDDWYPMVAGSGGSYEYGNVKLDESIVFEFTQNVDPSSLSGADGRNAISVYKNGGGTLVNGYYAVSGKKVTFYPQLQEIPSRTDILSSNTGYSVKIHAYDPSDRNHAIVKRLGVDASNTPHRMVLRPSQVDQAFMTGSGYLSDSTAPNFTALNTPTTDPAPNTTGIEVEIDDRLMPGSVTPSSFLVVAKAFSGVESVVTGDLSLQNIVDESGPGGALRRYSLLKLTPSMVLPPDGTTIEIRIGTGLSDFRGNSLGSSATTSFDTKTGTQTATGSKTENFNDTTNRDADLTTAFWGTADPANKGSAAGSGTAGKLTGLYDGGDGSDGALDLTSGNRTITTSSSNLGIFNYTYVKIPSGRTLTVEGTYPATIRVQKDAEVDGTLDADGKDGVDGFKYGSGSNQPGAKGGKGGPGGGDGGAAGSYTYKGTARVNGGDGKAGAGDTSSAGPGEGGGGIHYGAPGSVYGYWGGGGGGGGHATAGTDGGDGYTYYVSYYGDLGGDGGKKYGSSSLSTVEGGAGGGAGGTAVVYYTYYSQYGAGSGGGGGGGGGGIRLSANGEILLGSKGVIQSNGGDGGRAPSTYIYGTRYSRTVYPGGGGGGAAGSVHLQGSDLTLDGVIQAVGGTGGSSGYSGSYDGTGGDGGDGRVRLEKTGGLTGKLFTGKVFTPGTLVSTGNGGSNDWKITSDTTVNTDSGLGIPGYLGKSGNKILVKDFIVDATLTVTGSKPFIVEAAGKVEITGTILAAGDDGADASTSRYGSSSGWLFRLASGGKGVAGGFDGGDNGGSSSYSSSFPTATDGHGTDGKEGGDGAGEAGEKDDDPYVRKYSSYGYYYYYYSGGGGGGGGATAGSKGTTRSYYYGGKNRSGTPGDGGKAVVDGADLTASNLHGGTGGGGGANGGYVRRYWTSSYRYYYSYGPAAGAGSGGGGIMITAEDDMLLAGKILAPGGAGGYIQQTSSYYLRLSGGPGGGGAGGNVVLQAKDGFRFGVITIEAAGGDGGELLYNSTAYGTGGDGGDGALVLRTTKSLTLPPDLKGVENGDGSFSTGSFTPTKYGVSVWFDAGSFAPEFVSDSMTDNGGGVLWVEGAQTDPITGEADEMNTTGWIDVGSGSISDLNGYRWFRFRVELVGVSGKYPEVSLVRVDWKYRK